MSDNTHGGARPKQREDDGRISNGGAGRGQGRKPKSFTLKINDKLLVITKDAEERTVGDSQLWTIAEIDRSWLTIRSDNGDTIRIRR